MSDLSKPKKEKNEWDNRPIIHDVSLMEIFDFNEDAVRMNEQGFVSKYQQQKITQALQSDADALTLMLTIMLSVSIVLGVIFVIQGLAPMPLVIGIAAVILPLLFLGYRRQQTFKQDSDQLRAYRVDGVPSIEATLSEDKQAILRVADQTLPLSYQQAAALSEFALPMMRFYYAPNSKQILSAEVLDDPEFRKLKRDDVIEEDEFLTERQYEEDSAQMRR